MQYLKKTNKLFFDKYAYKVSITTPVASFFRGKNLNHAEAQITALGSRFSPSLEGKLQVGHSWSKKYASFEDVICGIKIVEVLKKTVGYTLRVEGTTLGIYSNDEEVIDKISSIANLEIREISKPETDLVKTFLLSKPKIIIRKEYTHKYKVTLKSMWEQESDFRQWAEKMPKIKIHAGQYTYGGYIYVADAKTLSICRLYLGNKVQKVEEIVSHSEI
jgi:heme-degrading monooxygenase HmoA